eukprot:3752748-Alexandrium_andersonii.AAC.1
MTSRTRSPTAHELKFKCVGRQVERGHLRALAEKPARGVIVVATQELPHANASRGPDFAPSDDGVHCLRL